MISPAAWPPPCRGGERCGCWRRARRDRIPEPPRSPRARPRHRPRMPSTHDLVHEWQGQRGLRRRRRDVLRLPGGPVRCKAGTKCGGSINNACVDACPKRCKDGKCCPKSKGRCVDGTCCPAIRTTFRPGSNKKSVACCPPGTIAVPGGAGECCPKGDANCCKSRDPDPADDLAPLGIRLKRGQLCVKGKVRKA